MKNIQRVGKRNHVERVGRRYNLSDIISESYGLLYECEVGSPLYRMTEGHINNIRKNPAKITELSRDLSVLKGLCKLGESAVIKESDIDDFTDEMDLEKENLGKDAKMDELDDEDVINEDEEIEGEDLEEEDDLEDDDLDEDEDFDNEIQLDEEEDDLEDELDEEDEEDLDEEDDEELEEDADLDELDDEDVIDEDANLAELEGEDVINEENEEDDTEITPEELHELKKHLKEMRKARKIKESKKMKKKRICESVEAKNGDRIVVKKSEENDYKSRGYKPSKDGYVVKKSEPSGVFIDEFRYIILHGDYDVVAGNGVVKESKSWKSEKATMTPALKHFRSVSTNKAFYNTFNKMSKRLQSNKPLTIQESILLYKASNSAMTQLAVELEHNPEFIYTFNECTNILSNDTDALLECIKSHKSPGKSLLESLRTFSEILLESDEIEDEEEFVEDEIIDNDDTENMDENDDCPNCDKEEIEENDDLESPDEELEEEDELEDEEITEEEDLEDEDLEEEDELEDEFEEDAEITDEEAEELKKRLEEIRKRRK